MPSFEEDVSVWSTLAVNEDCVIISVVGQVAMIYTGDLSAGVPINDLWFARRVPGYPVEMTRTQLLELRNAVDQALEVLVDEHADYRYNPREPESDSPPEDM